MQNAKENRGQLVERYYFICYGRYRRRQSTPTITAIKISKMVGRTTSTKCPSKFHSTLLITMSVSVCSQRAKIKTQVHFLDGDFSRKRLKVDNSYQLSNKTQLDFQLKLFTFSGRLCNCKTVDCSVFHPCEIYLQSVTLSHGFIRSRF